LKMRGYLRAFGRIKPRWMMDSRMRWRKAPEKLLGVCNQAILNGVPVDSK